MRKEYTYINKLSWGPGPWQEEADKIQWQDKRTGLLCVMLRSVFTGSWNAYVGIQSRHPFYMIDYTALTADIDVHGGLTYSGFGYQPSVMGWLRRAPSLELLDDLSDRALRYGSDNNDASVRLQSLRAQKDLWYFEWVKYRQARSICYGRYRRWWLGFDCAHLMDSTPRMDAMMPNRKLSSMNTYRTQSWVENEVAWLAQQLGEHQPLSTWALMRRWYDRYVMGRAR